ISCTNTSRTVYPTRSKARTVGTNPITIAAPSSKPGDEFVLDMATSAVALGKLEMCRRRGLPIPEGWGADKNGRSTSEPAVAIEEGALMPLGGEERNSGYKGYGLGMVVELFCGILADAAYGPNIRRWMNTDRAANLGQSFVAIDPNAFAPGFGQRLSEYMNIMRNLPRNQLADRLKVPRVPILKQL
ncbi:putative oxidoreductase YjmC, partial [Fasciola gigantica]